jgi:hypothetical protein
LARLVGVGLLGSGTAAAQPAQVDLNVMAPLPNDAPIGYFIDAGSTASGAHPGDAELCRWALEDWVRSADGRISVVPVSEMEARLRVYFAEPGRNQYGEMLAILVGGRRGAEVYVRPNTDALSPEIAAAARADPLLRETVVYLTCLHEIGHALGMQHTDRFADVMYYFGFGGDVIDFFNFYRLRIKTRDDIRQVSGLSAGDIAGLLTLYPDTRAE